MRHPRNLLLSGGLKIPHSFMAGLKNWATCPPLLDFGYWYFSNLGLQWDNPGSLQVRDIENIGSCPHAKKDCQRFLQGGLNAVRHCAFHFGLFRVFRG